MFDAADCCSIAVCLTRFPNLQDADMVGLDESPASCVASGFWQRVGLVPPPAEYIRQGWTHVIKYLQSGPFVPVHELRLMLIGDGEVGKTCLANAFLSTDHKAKWISKSDRTEGIVINSLTFAAEGHPSITCQVCDFAGQEIYLLSHTLHFTRRCLYMLVWTHLKFSDDQAVQLLAEDDILRPMKRWLQLLAVNVPEAKVLVVGTHCKVNPDVFCDMQARIDAQVLEEMDRLHFIAEKEAKATHAIWEKASKKFQFMCENLLRDFRQDQETRYPYELPNLNSSEKDCEHFVKKLSAHKPKPKRSLLLGAQSLLNARQDLTKIRLRLGRLHAVYDGSVPSANAAIAHLELVTKKSFAIDSLESVGLEDLLQAIEQTCRNQDALPFMGELVPVSWMQLKEALAHESVKECLGNCVISVEDAAAKVRGVLEQSPLDVGFDKARLLKQQDVQIGLHYWSIVGRTFVHNGHFLRDPWFVIEMMKPLVHPNVCSRKFETGFCKGSFDDVRGCLRLLQDESVLDHRLLTHFKLWADMSPPARLSLLSFFKESFMISHFTSEHSIVTARNCVSNDADRQRRISGQAADIEDVSEFYAVYAVPAAHIGLIARIHATVQGMQPSVFRLDVECDHDHVCIRLERSSPICCCVFLRSLDDVFCSKKLCNLRERVQQDIFSHAFVICSNNDGLFSFVSRCADNIMHSFAFSAHFECWLPVASSHVQLDTRADWVPATKDWVQLGVGKNTKRLSEILCANSESKVIDDPQMKMRDVFLRRPTIFMSHSFIRGNMTSGDGSGEFCKRLKDALQEQLLCSVWFDKDEMGWTSQFCDFMKIGIANANAFVICLSPLYLTRPNCLRELIWAMEVCKHDKSKRLHILPLHPSVSFFGCKTIVDLDDVGCAAQVVLPADDQNPKSPPRDLHQLKGHKLSKVAVDILRCLTGPQNVGTNAEWLKLQPWLSDFQGLDWEETSECWHGPKEGACVKMAECIDQLVLDLRPAVLGDRKTSSLDLLLDKEDRELCSEPRSQEYLQMPDTSLIRRCFPQMMYIFSEQDAVRLIALGLRDVHVISCIEHGCTKISNKTSQPNPVDPVFRMAAHMSGVDFDAAAETIKNIKKLYALPNLFLEFDQLLTIISSPVSLNSEKPFNTESVMNSVTETDILRCIEAGRPCGVMEHIDCHIDLKQIFALAKMKLIQLTKEDPKSISGAYFANSADVDAPANVVLNRENFFRWLMEKRKAHIVCRVEGSDDVLLIDALMDWSSNVIRSPPSVWNDFSYKAKMSNSSVEMQIRLSNIADVELHQRTGVLAHQMDGSIHAWNDRISSLFRDASYFWIDILDSDLKVPVCALGQCTKSGKEVFSYCWKSRGIENMLLHPTCPLWFVQNEHEVASIGFCEIFQTISKNFFGTPGSGELAIISAVQNSGPGWMNWHKLTYEQAHSECRGTIVFLQRVICAVLESSNSVASIMLVLLEFFSEICCLSHVECQQQKRAIKQIMSKYDNIFALIAKELKDKDEFQRELQRISGASNSTAEHRCKAMWCIEEALMNNEQAIILLCQKKDPPSRVPKDARSAFWERNKSPAFFAFAFPRFLCFLNSLHSVVGIATNIQEASRLGLIAVYPFLCEIPFGIEVREGVNAILFKSKTDTKCSGYFPHSANDMCICCKQPHNFHILKHDGRGASTQEVQFARVACRVGSIGWASHRLMELVHGTRHLGVRFEESRIAVSQSSYRQHLCQHIYSSHPSRSDFKSCEQCASKSLAMDSLPLDVRKEVQRLQTERTEELNGIIHAIERFFSPEQPSAKDGHGIEQIGAEQTRQCSVSSSFFCSTAASVGGGAE
jgi:GTPase SAR1 family protein